MPELLKTVDCCTWIIYFNFNITSIPKFDHLDPPISTYDHICWTINRTPIFIFDHLCPAIPIHFYLRSKMSTFVYSCSQISSYAYFHQPMSTYLCQPISTLLKGILGEEYNGRQICYLCPSMSTHVNLC